MNDARLQAARLVFLWGRVFRGRGLSFWPIEFQRVPKLGGVVLAKGRTKTLANAHEQFQGRRVGVKQFKFFTSVFGIEVAGFEHALQGSHQTFGCGDFRSHGPWLGLVIQLRKRFSLREKSIKPFAKRHFHFHGVMHEVMNEHAVGFQIHAFGRSVRANGRKTMTVGIRAGHQDTHGLLDSTESAIGGRQRFVVNNDKTWWSDEI